MASQRATREPDPLAPDIPEQPHVPAISRASLLRSWAACSAPPRWTGPPAAGPAPSVRAAADPALHTGAAGGARVVAARGRARLAGAAPLSGSRFCPALPVLASSRVI